MFGSTTPSMFGSSTPSLFGSPAPSSFGSSTPALFGSPAPSSFGSSTPSLFGSSTPSLFASSSPSMFGSSTPTMSTPQAGGGLSGSTPAFGQAGGLPGFGQSTPSFGQSAPSVFGQTTPSLFNQPQQSASQPSSIFGQSAFGQTQPSLFGQSQGQPTPSGQPFGLPPGSMFGAPQQQMFQTPQLTTQMAPVAPVVIPLPDREVQAFIDAYKEEPGNPKYGFKHLLLSVTDPSARVKPVGISDIMWAEALNKLEGMDSADRERLWPEVVQGFKDLSKRMQLQDDAIAADVQRLQATEANVKLLHRHFDTDTLPWIQRLRQKEQELQRRILKVMRIVEALEGKGFRMPLTRAETKLGEQLRTLTRQLQGTVAEIPRRVDELLSRSRMQVGVGQGSSMLLLGPGKIDDQSLQNMQEVLRQQTEAIAHLTGVLKRDIRDVDIVVSENAEMPRDGDSVPRGFIWNAGADVAKLGTPVRKHSSRIF